jgi:hypothetical protein
VQRPANIKPYVRIVPRGVTKAARARLLSLLTLSEQR